MTDKNRTVKINDDYPAYSGKTYSAKDLMPDPEIVTELNRMLGERIKSEMAEQENWLRCVSIPLIQEGYRLEELELIISSDRHWRQGKPLRILLPAKDVGIVRLWGRRQWRHAFPYRLPNGQIYDKIVREVVTLK